jgi:putative SOS response-associated peptidase YedK
MVGCYELKATAGMLVRQFPSLHCLQGRIVRKEEIMPAEHVPVVTGEAGLLSGELVRWGLVGSFLEQAPPVPVTTLRGEDLDSRPFYGRLLKEKRCLIPATAFFEWCTDASGNRRRARFSHPASKPFLMAGVFDRHPRAGTSCAILTISANEALAAFSERMPLILSRDEAVFWLSEHPEFPADEFAAMTQQLSRMPLKVDLEALCRPSSQLSLAFA